MLWRLTQKIIAKSMLCLNADAARRATVGIIVIGDEILKGSTQDINSNFMCRRLHARGIIVRKISVVGDAVEDIATEVAAFSQMFDVVFTTGGIGPTHDDRTFAGIARAFGEDLALNEELKRMVDKFLQESNITNVEKAVEKFCRIPKNAKLIWPSDGGNNNNEGSDDESSKRKEIVFLSEKQTAGEGDTVFPSLQVHNVIALPGVPSFCQRNFEYLENYLFPRENPFFSRTLFLQKSEIYLESKLSEIASDQADKGVSIGSYPVLHNSYFKTKLIVESDSQGTGSNAHNQLTEAFKDILVNVDERPWENSMDKLMEFRERQDTVFQTKIDDALATINTTLETYKLDQIALSFNGGKDCTILLHLLRCCMDRYYKPGTHIRGFQVLNDEEFPEICDFVDEISKSYNLNMTRVNATLKSGLVQLKRGCPDVVAVLMGSRRADPNGRFMASRCEWTDADWPHFYRVCPILDWTYGEVWRAIRGLYVPYCRIYNHGYTSLGARSSTHPNPALLTVDEHGNKKFLPAFHLADEMLERSSRENSRAGLNTLATQDEST